MQILQSPLKVEDNTKKADLLEIVSDKYCRSILNAIMDKPKSAVELSRECQIPISTIYRRIQMLHDAKMLNTSGQISEEGKKFFLYKSKIKEINACYNKGDVQVELVFNQ
ncbi:MAG: winged helix-turn-helix domain-containing protein [Nitrosopumilus sp.]|nr:winged helix-turn-helix domain-containing protein [Nitrosopumilus sp.]MDH3384746.1 winged helix-turn-helix domain-containing protein [Nitrosopumilus sp.]